MIDSLKEFYTTEQIRAFWKQAAEAMMSRSTESVTITGTTFEGESHSGIVLSTPAEITAFINACQQAIRELGSGTGVDPSTLGTGINFAHRVLEA